MWVYNELVDVTQQDIRQTGQKNSSIGNRKARKWWDKEIKQARKEHKQASRDLRKAQKVGYTQLGSLGGTNN